MSTPFIKTEVVLPEYLLDLAEEPQGLAGFSRILLMGDSGTGKTHFIGTMPKPFVCDFDRGLQTLRGKPVKALPYNPDDWAAFRKEVMDWRKGPKYDCLTFAVDSLSMAADSAMRYVLNKNGRAGQQPNIAEWGEAIREVKDLLGYLTTLPCNVVVTAHMEMVKDELLGDLQYRPLIFGKDLPSRLPIYFDDVFKTVVQTKLEGGKTVSSYRLQVKPDMRTSMIKSRMNTDGKLFEQYEEPDYGVLTKKLK